MLTMRMDWKLVDVNVKSIQNKKERKCSRSKRPRGENHTFLSEFTKYLESKSIKLDKFYNKEKAKLFICNQEKKYQKEKLIETSERKTQNQNGFDSNSRVDLKELKLIIPKIKTEQEDSIEIELPIKVEQTIKLEPNNKQLNKTLMIKLERLPKNLVTKLLAPQNQLHQCKESMTLNHHLQHHSIKKEKVYYDIKQSYVLLKRLPVNNIIKETNVNDKYQETYLRTDNIKKEIEESFYLTNGLSDQESQKLSKTFHLDSNNHISEDNVNIILHENKHGLVKTIQEFDTSSRSDEVARSRSDNEDCDKNKLHQESGLQMVALPNDLKTSCLNINTRILRPRDKRLKMQFTRRNLTYNKICCLNNDTIKEHICLPRTRNSKRIKNKIQRTSDDKVVNILKQKTQFRRSYSHPQSMKQDKLKSKLIFNKNLNKNQPNVETKNVLSKNNLKFTTKCTSKRKQNIRKITPKIKEQQLESQFLTTDTSKYLVDRKLLSVSSKCKERQRKNKNTSSNNKENKHKIIATILDNLDQTTSKYRKNRDTKTNMQFKDHVKKNKHLFKPNPVHYPPSNRFKSPHYLRKRDIQCSDNLRGIRQLSHGEPVEKSTISNDSQKPVPLNLQQGVETISINPNPVQCLSSNIFKSLHSSRKRKIQCIDNLKEITQNSNSNPVEKYTISDNSQNPLYFNSQQAVQAVTITDSMQLTTNNFFDSYVIIDNNVEVHRQKRNYSNLLQRTFKQQFEQHVPKPLKDETLNSKKTKRKYNRRKVYFQPQRLASMALEMFFRNKILK